MAILRYSKAFLLLVLMLVLPGCDLKVITECEKKCTQDITDPNQVQACKDGCRRQSAGQGAIGWMP